MRYSINGEFYRAIRITGPTHNLLGLSFCQGVPETVAVERLKDRSERGLDESLLRQAVLAGVATANAAFGTDYQVARIQYVPTDTPNGAPWPRRPRWTSTPPAPGGSTTPRSHRSPAAREPPGPAPGVASGTGAVRGAATSSEARHQTLPWTLNPGGPRSIEDATAFARQHGIQIPEEVDLIPVPDEMVKGAFAEYATLGEMSGTEQVTLSTLKHNLTGRIPVRIQQGVLASDEAILAVFGHEMHEINALRTILQERGAIPAGELFNLINGQSGRLHLDAVAVGDKLVLQLRGAAK